MKDYKRLIQLLRSFKSSVILSIIFNALTAVFTLISIPLIMPFFQILFDTSKSDSRVAGSSFEVQLKSFFENLIARFDAPKAVLVVCGLIVMAFLFKNLFRYLAFAVMAPVRSGIMRKLRSSLFSQYLDLPSKTIKSVPKGDLITRISSDVQEVEYSILQFLQILIKSPLMIVGSICFMLFLNAKLTILVFFLLVFIALIMGNISKLLKKDSQELQSSLSDIVSHTEESISGWLSIRSFNAYKDWQERFETANHAYADRFTSFLRRRELSSPLSEFLGIVVVAILLALGAMMVLDLRMAPESFFAFILAFYFVIEPAKSFSNAFYHLKRGSVALNRIDEILGFQDQSRNTSTSLKALKIRSLESIEFDHVYYKFEDSNQYILKDICISIPINKITAFVGPSGSGKTSMVMLLLKIYEPTKGSILINGVDLRDIDTYEWRAQLGFVPQDPFMFNDSIRKNLLFGREFDDAALLRSLSSAAALDLIEGKEERLDYGIGERGDKLSGGQKQRLSIARAILGRPELLMLDEPTSALDPKAEDILSKSMAKATKERTSIVIAHRLSTVKDAHQIILFVDGEVMDIGDHQSLSLTNSMYKDYIVYQSFEN